MKRFAVVLFLLALVACTQSDRRFANATSMEEAAAEARGATSASFAVSRAQRIKRFGSFASSPDRGELLTYPARDSSRQNGAYTWHRASVSEEHALRAIVERKLRMVTPAGEVLDIEYDHHIEHPSGDWTWVGHLPGHPEAQTIVTFGAEAVFGSIAQAGKRSLRLTSRDGVAWLVETDPSKLGGLASAGANPDKPDTLAVPKQLLAGQISAAPAQLEAAPAVTLAAAATTIDVLVGYTGGIASRTGGASAALTRINFLVATTNEAYANSQVSAQVRLVHAMQVNYTDTSTNESALEQLTGYDVSEQQYTTPNAAFNALRAAREQYGADLVVVLRQFRDPEQDGCGIAWLVGGGKAGIAPGDGNDYFGYSVVSDGTDRNEQDGNDYYCRDESFAHELAHNMGSQHDREEAKGVDGVLNDPDDYGAFPYSFAYKTGATAGNFFTIMAYGDEGQQDYRVFSNPRISSVCGGRACGTVNDDNARSLGQLMPVVAGFRNTVVPVVGGARNDINGDGRSDLVLHNKASNRMSWWLMNGNVATSAPASKDVAGYSLVATGNFNGDAYGDLVWSNGISIWLWQGTGSDFTPRLIGSQPTGWKIVGSTDVNGDGRSDLVLHNQASNRMSWWLMNGNVATSAPASKDVTGYSLVATGNFNGDAYGDLVWSNGISIWLWQGTGSDFTPRLIGTQPTGWKIVGSTDVNGDGRSDLVLHNQASNRMSWWLMNGNVATSAPATKDVTGYSLVTTGNFNGDAYGDLVWSNGASIWLWQGTGSNFTAMRIGNQPSGWVIQY